MTSDLSTAHSSSELLWEKVVNEGVEDRVEVNQRMLIDKMLARYSADFVVFRELIQNSDDAQATSFTLEITCDINTEKQNYEPTIKDENTKQGNNILEGIGQLFRSQWGSTSTSNSNSTVNDSPLLDNDRLSPSEIDFDNCIIREIRSINNGKPFDESDWKRVITIAEGNSDAEAIGQFGVGFFSVFSYSERPMIQSGKYCLAFVWKNGKSLTTFRKELSTEEINTTIILSMRNKYILQTKSKFDSKNNISRPTRSKKNVLTNQIVPTIDLTQLKGYFTKVLSFTKYINELTIQINDLIVFQVNKKSFEISSNKSSFAPKKLNSNNEHNFLRFNSFFQSEQKFVINNGPSITLNRVDIEASVILDKDFHLQIERVLKKSLPSRVKIQILFPSNNLFDDPEWKSLNDNSINSLILKGLIPLKILDGEIIPSGQVFIGLATHQSTGIGMHVFTHLIPTIERENLDLQDPYISIWNEQLLASIGKVVRFIYDQTIIDAVNKNSSQELNYRLNEIFIPYAFQPSAPNKEIGRILCDGFFSSDNDILVPVKRSPSDCHLSLIPSSEAFLTSSKHIQSFLPIPLVPFDLGKNEFFKTLKTRRWIQEIDHQTLLIKLHQSILLTNEFVALLRWLCTNDIPNKCYIKQVLELIRYRDTLKSSIIKLEKILFYDSLNITSLPLPLPTNVLPNNIIGYISKEDLHKRLALLPIDPNNLIEFYLHSNQQELFKNENTSKILLNFLSERWNQLNETESLKVKATLSNLKCISTTQGMKSPNESYIKSENLSNDLPIIKLYIPQIEKEKEKEKEKDEYPVSIQFLKSIGCRTIHVPTLSNPLSDLSPNPSQTNETFINNLLQQRKNLSDNDLHALKYNQCLTGKTFDSNVETKRQYIPRELHFPTVGKRLEWFNLAIIDWEDIDSRSQEYSFLKELGVREVPELPKLINRIVEEHHNQGKKNQIDYKIPLALTFFAENFQEHYSKWWKNANIKIPFLPSFCQINNSIPEVRLSTPETVFKESGPLCPSLLPDVLKCFSLYFDIGLLGVKHRPNLSTAFEIVLEKRNELLTFESAPKLFGYLNKLDGLNRTFIERISKLSFIPLTDLNIYLKPCQVFIRSKTPSTSPISQDNDFDSRGLIDYIDYGSEGNCFLLSIGVVPYPSPSNLADLLIERQSNYFSKIKDISSDLVKIKLRIYTNCLKQIASVSKLSREFNVEPLRSRLITKPWCLGYQTIEKSDGNKERIFKIVKPSEIYLDDDHQCAIDLRPLCAPDEPELTKLYEQFGSKWLSESVKRTLVHRGKFFTTDRSLKLKDLINSRLDMLFVNNRGERMDNTDDKRIELLRTKFIVYESEGIQCQLTFENKIINLNTNECSSCALEHEKNKGVSLFIQTNLPSLDYIDIGTELTRFVYKKSIDSILHSISDKLASPLETLKRRGIPVDRLLKIQDHQQIKLSIQQGEQTQPEEKQPPIPQPVQQEHRHQQPKQDQRHQQVKQEHQHQHQHQQQIAEQQRPKSEHFQSKVDEQEEQRGFFQNLKDLLSVVRLPLPLPSPRDQVEPPVESTVKRDRIDNFGKHVGEDDGDIESMIRTSRPYTQREFNQSEHTRNEINNSCEFVPSSSMIRHSNLLNGIYIYIDKNIELTNEMISNGKQLSFLLIGLATQVFQIPKETIHLFRDIDSARIAFNSNGSLFFNLRYFSQVFSSDLKFHLENSSSTSSIVRTLVNFYYMVTCHELSHNIDSNHDLNFINRLERVSVRFMDLKDEFMFQFTFQ